MVVGEAYQFDWGHEIVVINGTAVTVKVAHMRLCHSRMPWLVSTMNLLTSGKRAGAMLGPTFEEDEAAAAAAGVGLWRGAFIPPWEWRRQR